MAGPGPRPFSCLWCGRTWQPRSADDLEARARLCPDCLGRAGENPFLQFRLRAGLEGRAAAGGGRGGAGTAVGTGRAAGTPPHEDELVPYYEARAPEYDDWYLRRGRYAHGPVHDLAWQMELDAATTWLDRLPLGGEIVELAAGTGWWSALLATKGELHAYDAAAAPLDRARDRLVAHRLRAHLHVRDAWAAPDRSVDALFAGFWLSHVPRPRLGDFLAIARRMAEAGRPVRRDRLPGGPRVGRGRPASRARPGPLAASPGRRPRVHDPEGPLHARRACGRPVRRRLRRGRGPHDRPLLRARDGRGSLGGYGGAERRSRPELTRRHGPGPSDADAAPRPGAAPPVGYTPGHVAPRRSLARHHRHRGHGRVDDRRPDPRQPRLARPGRRQSPSRRAARGAGQHARHPRHAPATSRPSPAPTSSSSR